MSDRDTKAKEYDAVVSGLRDEPCAFKRQCFRDGWDAAIAALPDMVRPLEWETPQDIHFEKGHCHGATEEIAYLAPLEWYRVYPVSDGKWRWVKQFRMSYVEGNTADGNEPDSAEAAKAAAQTHHTAAFMSALGVQGGEA